MKLEFNETEISIIDAAVKYWKKNVDSGEFNNPLIKKAIETILEKTTNYFEVKK